MSWRDKAACSQTGPNLFFTGGTYNSGRVPAGQTHQNFLPAVIVAKRICNGCPVKSECLEYALDAREPDGIWGGLTVDERRDVLKRRHRTA